MKNCSIPSLFSSLFQIFIVFRCETQYFAVFLASRFDLISLAQSDQRNRMEKSDRLQCSTIAVSHLGSDGANNHRRKSERFFLFGCRLLRTMLTAASTWVCVKPNQIIPFQFSLRHEIITFLFDGFSARRRDERSSTSTFSFRSMV